MEASLLLKLQELPYTKWKNKQTNKNFDLTAPNWFKSVCLPKSNISSAEFEGIHYLKKNKRRNWTGHLEKCTQAVCHIEATPGALIWKLKAGCSPGLPSKTEATLWLTHQRGHTSPELHLKLPLRGQITWKEAERLFWNLIPIYKHIFLSSPKTTSDFEIEMPF